MITNCHKEAADAGLLKTMLHVQGGYVWHSMRREIEGAKTMSLVCGT